MTLPAGYGWNYYAEDWSKLNNLCSANAGTALYLAWYERISMQRMADALAHLKNMTELGTIDDLWLSIIPHYPAVTSNGVTTYEIYRGSASDAIQDCDMSGAYKVYSNCGWIESYLSITSKITDIPTVITSSPYSLVSSVPEMEEAIGETILPYPNGCSLTDGRYYRQFYKIINALQYQYDLGSGAAPGLEVIHSYNSGLWSNIISQLADQRIYSASLVAIGEGGNSIYGWVLWWLYSGHLLKKVHVWSQNTQTLTISDQGVKDIGDHFTYTAGAETLAIYDAYSPKPPGAGSGWSAVTNYNTYWVSETFAGDMNLIFYVQ